MWATTSGLMPTPVSLNRQLDVAARPDVRMQAGVLVVELGVARFDGQSPARGHRVACVDGQVHHHLLHLSTIRPDRWQGGATRMTNSMCSPIVRASRFPVSASTEFRSRIFGSAGSRR